MTEVSCRAAATLLEAAERCDLPRETVLEGIPLEIERLRDPHGQISWETFLAIIDRLQELGGFGLLEQVGRQCHHSSWSWVHALVSRFAWSERQFWSLVMRRVAPALFPVVVFGYERLDGRRFRLTARIPTPHRASAGFLTLMTAIVRAGPAMMGRPEPVRTEVEVRRRLALMTLEAASPPHPARRVLRALGGRVAGSPLLSRLERRDRRALRTAAELARRNQALATLQAVADAITQSVDFAGTAQRIVDAVAANTEFKAVALYVRSEDDERLELAARHGPDPRAGTPLPQVLPFGSGLGTAAFDSQRIEWVGSAEEHLELHPEIRLHLGELGLKAAAVVPLLFQDRVVGALGLASRRRRSFDAGDEASLLALGKTAAAALTSARHVSRVEREVDERRRVEQALRESEERVREVAENADGVFYLLDAATDRLLYLSPTFEKLTGHPAAALTEDFRSILQWVHPDDRARVIETVGPTGDLREYDMNFRLLHADGSLIHVRDRAKLVRDAEGRPVRILGFAQDMTRTRELEQQVLRSQKMDAVGRLAGGIAHDFNNLLTVISGHGEVLQDRFDSADPGGASGASVAEILKAATRASNLTRRLLTLARKQPESAEALDVGTVVRELGPLLESLLGEAVELDLDLAPVPLPVRMDRGMLEQVLVNLAVNAKDAMPEGGRFSARTQAGSATAASLVLWDDGSGMDPEVQSRAFEPFFSTKDPGRGTGLGLATVHGIIENAGGRVRMESTLGEGTRFEIELPLSEPVGAVLPVARPQATQGSETLLLVEDQDEVRDVACRALRAHGYRVIECRDAGEALEQDLDPEVALLVTDVVMPGMSGTELAKRLSERRPELPVLFLSGYPGDEMLGSIRSSHGFLAKPFTSRALACAVRERLDA